MNTFRPCIAATLLLAAACAAQAQLTGPAQGKSLSQARSEIIKGTSPGITLIEAGPAKPAAAAPATAPAAPAATQTAAAGMAAPAAPAAAAAPATAEGPTVAERLGGLWKSLPPPSGVPLGTARRGESPTSGINMPAGAKPSTP